jgi:hypothetical protein
MGTTKDYLEKAEALFKDYGIVAPKRILDDDNKLLSKSFEANGYTYVVLDIEESFNIERAEAHNLIEQMFAAGKSLEQLVTDNIKSVDLFDNLLSKGGLADLGAHLKGIAENYFKDNLMRKHIAMYEATLFIVRKGDDLKWNFDKAEEYIKDWAIEGIYAPDFFSLALHRFPKYIAILKQRMGIGSKDKEQAQSKVEKDSSTK